eukprot:gene26100-34708_t
MVAYLISRYDAIEDTFDDLDMQAYEIVRIPRIGNGKHNVHFDPQFSEQHGVLQQLAAEAGFAQLLSTYMGKQCSLRETGISVTRPILIDHKRSTTHIPGEGMEWHSDGSRGEATVLMTLEDIDPTMGSLHVIPGSHHEYIDGVGHEEDLIVKNFASIEKRKISYNYRALQPMIIDARTMHSVSNNQSSRWRIVVWFIYDSY